MTEDAAQETVQWRVTSSRGEVAFEVTLSGWFRVLAGPDAPRESLLDDPAQGRAAWDLARSVITRVPGMLDAPLQSDRAEGVRRLGAAVQSEPTRTTLSVLGAAARVSVEIENMPARLAAMPDRALAHDLAALAALFGGLSRSAQAP